MFMMVGTKSCPACGIAGKNWKDSGSIFICPNCSTIFSEFGIVSRGEDREVNPS